MWAMYPSYKSNVEAWWKDCEVEGNKRFKFTKKFQVVKKNRTLRNKKTFGKLGSNKDTIWEELSHIDFQCANGIGLSIKIKVV